LKATKAYIASLGTTGVLLAASILMLAVVSAVVAFDRWPGDKFSSNVQTLVLTDQAPAIRVSASATGPSPTPDSRSAAVSAVTGPPRATPNIGDVGGERFTGGTRTPSSPAPSNPAPAATDPATKALQPVQDTATPIFDSISNPGTTAGQVADGTQAVTDAAGVSVGRVSPDVGSAVAGAGQTVSQTIREVPLPDHVLPGH
jgi:hypothetical protein